MSVNESDIEEPPSKLSKFQMEAQYLEGEELEEGQEEWLSEGILTDDDYPAAEHDQSGNTSQDETMASLNGENSMERLESSQENSQDISQENSQDTSHLMQDTTMHSEENIEETLNNFEKSENKNKMDLPDDLDTFLVRKTVISAAAREEDVAKEGGESDKAGSAKQSEDDGNDTDDLLRVLGDGDDKRKAAQRGKREAGSSDEDDDEYIFEGAKVTTLKVATNALRRSRPPTRAVPEDDDITDASSDEADTMMKMFSVQPPKAVKSSTPVTKATKSLVQKTAKSTTPVQKAPAPVKAAARPVRQTVTQRRVVKKTVNFTHKPAASKLSQSPPLKTYTNTRRGPSANDRPPKPSVPTVGRGQPKMALGKDHEKDSLEMDRTAYSERPLGRAATPPPAHAQRMMRPERMDEEVPTDMDSDSDEESLYDELPTSDSETAEDWFSLDIRAERAGDYIPLLGGKAHGLLSEEKRRVTERVTTLKESLAALADSGRGQAAQLRQATVALAELDAMLKAA